MRLHGHARVQLMDAWLGAKLGPSPTPKGVSTGWRAQQGASSAGQLVRVTGNLTALLVLE